MKIKNRSKFKNVTVWKIKSLPLTSEDRLKELQSIYSKIPIDKKKNLNQLKTYLVILLKEYHQKVIKNLK